MSLQSNHGHRTQAELGNRGDETEPGNEDDHSDSEEETMGNHGNGRLKELSREIFRGLPTGISQAKLEKELMLLQDRLMSTLACTETVPIEELQETLASFSKKTPVTLIMELAQCLKVKVNFVEVGSPQGPSHAPRFTVVTVMDGRPFTRVSAGNKRDCKNGAAYLAWKTLLTEQQQALQIELDVLSSNASLPRYLALLSHLQYLKVVQKNPLAFTGRRVLAAVILQKKQRKPKHDIFRVASLATGNRCIMTSALSLDGSAVNDSHAEVLARRALLRFLSNEISRSSSKSCESILEPSSVTSKLRVKSSIAIHLYISDAPCGDASLFTKSEDVREEDLQSKQSIFSSKHHGLLRIKIEAGEGAIPVEKGASQSLISLQFGGRLRTMTCSDKILKWNVVGVQGSLLSHFMDPVYLASVSIGNHFVFGHTTRALYQRLSPPDSRSEPSVPPTVPESRVDLPLPPGYRCVCPALGDGSIESPWQETERSSAVSMVWTFGDESAEVIDGTTGRLLYQEKVDRSASPSESDEETSAAQFSRISKRALLDNFLLLCQKLNRPELSGSASLYHEYKDLASDYQTAKHVLYDKLETLGYGRWIKKPEELQYFGN